MQIYYFGSYLLGNLEELTFLVRGLDPLEEPLGNLFPSFEDLLLERLPQKFFGLFLRFIQ